MNPQQEQLPTTEPQQHAVDPHLLRQIVEQYEETNRPFGTDQDYSEEDAKALGLPSPKMLNFLNKFVKRMIGTPFVPAWIAASANPAGTMLACIIRGREMGFQPLESTEVFWKAPDGRLGLYSKPMTAIMLRSGAKIDHTVDTDEEHSVTGTRTDGNTYTARFTKEDAITAGLLQKNQSMHVKYPRRMFKWRCLSDLFNTLFADLTGNGSPIFTAEELQSEFADTERGNNSDRAFREEGKRQTENPYKVTPKQASPEGNGASAESARTSGDREEAGSGQPPQSGQEIDGLIELAFGRMGCIKPGEKLTSTEIEMGRKIYAQMVKEKREITFLSLAIQLGPFYDWKWEESNKITPKQESPEAKASHDAGNVDGGRNNLHDVTVPPGEAALATSSSLPDPAKDTNPQSDNGSAKAEVKVATESSSGETDARQSAGPNSEIPPTPGPGQGDFAKAWAEGPGDKPSPVLDKSQDGVTPLAAPQAQPKTDAPKVVEMPKAPNVLAQLMELIPKDKQDKTVKEFLRGFLQTSKYSMKDPKTTEALTVMAAVAKNYKPQLIQDPYNSGVLASAGWKALMKFIEAWSADCRTLATSIGLTRYADSGGGDLISYLEDPLHVETMSEPELRAILTIIQQFSPATATKVRESLLGILEIVNGLDLLRCTEGELLGRLAGTTAPDEEEPLEDPGELLRLMREGPGE